MAFNRFGLRDSDYPVQKPPGTIRIVVLGDSMTFGVGVPEPRTFPRVTEKLLNQSPGRAARVEVLNFGIPGYNTLQEVSEFEELGSPLRPDIVVVGFLYNDLEISPEGRRRLGLQSTSAAAPQPAPPLFSPFARRRLAGPRSLPSRRASTRPSISSSGTRCFCRG